MERHGGAAWRGGTSSSRSHIIVVIVVVVFAHQPAVEVNSSRRDEKRGANEKTREKFVVNN